VSYEVQPTNEHELGKRNLKGTKMSQGKKGICYKTWELLIQWPCKTPIVANPLLTPLYWNTLKTNVKPLQESKESSLEDPVGVERMGLNGVKEIVVMG
jgi:hypothetical protein